MTIRRPSSFGCWRGTTTTSWRFRSSFCAGCPLAYGAGLATPILVTLAWIFVALRVVHTLIHVTYNGLWHRITAFVLSTLVLMGFWVVLGRAVLALR